MNVHFNVFSSITLYWVVSYIYIKFMLGITYVLSARMTHHSPTIICHHMKQFIEKQRTNKIKQKQRVGVAGRGTKPMFKKIQTNSLKT